MIKTVDCATLKSWMDKGEAVLLDVREPAEHASEAIPGAILLPMGQLSSNALPPLSGRKLVVHCRKGGRGSRACEQLAAENIDIYNLEGGIEGWVAAGLPVKSGDSKMLPLDRQVQLAVGLIILIGSLLGYLVAPLFFLLTGLIGCGLIFAGLTGVCTLAMLLAKMPWNQQVGSSSGTSCMIRTKP